ncbi:MAG: flavin reductase family protein [Dehalococcoidia bacterium]
MSDDPARTFRDVMGAFATGITLVTAARHGVYTGMTVNSFTSVSLNPMLVLVCVDLTAETHPIIADSKAFAINILSAEQESISRTFATKDPGKDAAIRALPIREGKTGTPILTEALAFIEARVVQEIHAGDHTVFIGQVVDSGMTGDEPILFYRGKYRSLAEVPS